VSPGWPSPGIGLTEPTQHSMIVHRAHRSPGARRGPVGWAKGTVGLDRDAKGFTVAELQGMVTVDRASSPRADRRPATGRLGSVVVAVGAGHLAARTPPGGKLQVDRDVEPPVARVQMYMTTWCGYCRRAEALLTAKGIPYEAIDVGGDAAFRHRLLALTGGRTVPQILIDGEPIGGYSELRALEHAGRLDELCAAEPAHPRDAQRSADA